MIKLSRLKKTINRFISSRKKGKSNPFEEMEKEDYRFFIRVFDYLNPDYISTQNKRGIIKKEQETDDFWSRRKKPLVKRVLKTKELETLLKLTKKYEIPVKEKGDEATFYYLGNNRWRRLNAEIPYILLKINKDEISREYVPKFYSFVQGAENQRLLAFYSSVIT